MQAFMPLMVDNARASREQEPGCRQFDVCLDPAAPNVAFPYEICGEVAAKVARTYIRADAK
jgi:quinol monooxygenase YgiN